MAKKLFELQRELDAVKAEYHELAPDLSPNDAAPFHTKIKGLQALMSDTILTGVKAGKDENMHGFKKGRGLYVVLDLVTERSARGETPDEAVDNWNNGNFYVPPETPPSPIGKAPAEEAAEDE